MIQPTSGAYMTVNVLDRFLLGNDSRRMLCYRRQVVLYFRWFQSAESVGITDTYLYVVFVHLPFKALLPNLGKKNKTTTMSDKTTFESSRFEILKLTSSSSTENLKVEPWQRILLSHFIQIACAFGLFGAKSSELFNNVLQIILTPIY